jgi:Spy/CpxP family protein refolding chaperone
MENSNQITTGHFANRQKLPLTFLSFLFFLIISFSGFCLDQKPDSLKKGFSGIPNLTDTQKLKIKELRNNLKKEILPIRNQIGEKRARLNTLETSPKPEIESINSTIQEIQNLKTKILKIRAVHVQEVRKLLTEEQRIEFDLRKQKLQKKLKRKAGKKRFKEQ